MPVHDYFWNDIIGQQLWQLEACDKADANQSSYLQKFFYIFVATLSMTGSILVALSIFYNKKLQAHPQYLIACICICEGISCFNGVVWAISSEYISCYFGLNQLLSWTLLFNEYVCHSFLFYLAPSKEQRYPWTFFVYRTNYFSSSSKQCPYC